MLHDNNQGLFNDLRYHFISVLASKWKCYDVVDSKPPIVCPHLRGQLRGEERQRVLHSASLSLYTQRTTEFLHQLINQSACLVMNSLFWSEPKRDWRLKRPPLLRQTPLSTPRPFQHFQDTMLHDMRGHTLPPIHTTDEKQPGNKNKHTKAKWLNQRSTYLHYGVKRLV